MNIKEVKEWQCENGFAVAVNPFCYADEGGSDFMNESPNEYLVRRKKYQDFYSWANDSTNQPRTTLNGLYKADKVELREVYEYKNDGEWCYSPKRFYEAVSKNPNIPTRLSYELVLKPVKEEITINLNDYSISMEDLERAFCYGYLANPDNSALDNLELMRKWQICKDSFITPMLINKHIID